MAHERFLIAAAVSPNDLMADMQLAINEMAKSLGCRVVFYTGLIETKSAESDAGVPEQKAIKSNGKHTANGRTPVAQVNRLATAKPVSPAPVPDPAPDPAPESVTDSSQYDAVVESGITRRMFCNIAMIAAKYPTNDDLYAIRNEIAGLGKNDLRVLIVNPGIGEYVISILGASQTAQIFCASDGTEPDAIREVFAANTHLMANVHRVQKVDVAGVSPQGLDAVILVDPLPDDFGNFAKHCRIGGFVAFCTTNGSTPDFPDRPLRLKTLTQSVAVVYRDDVAAAPQAVTQVPQLEQATKLES